MWSAWPIHVARVWPPRKRDFPSSVRPVCEPVRQSLASVRASAIASYIRERRMAELKADVLVLGAGMVGVSAALHLQQRGRDVILVDRNERAGEETSYGNAGLIECASVFPYMFPRDFGQILRYAFNRAPQVRYSVADLGFLPWLLRYYLASSPQRA